MDLSPDTWKKIKDIVKCPVCYDMLNDAKFLPCGHTFCQSCLEECHRHQPSTIGMSCPMCKENSTVSSFHHMRAGLSDLPKNLIAEDVAEVVRNLTGSENAGEEIESTIRGLLPARPAESRPRPGRCTQVLRRMCRWLPTIIRCILGILVFLAVLREEDKQHLSTLALVICREFEPHKLVEEDWKSKMTAFYHQISEELFGRKREEQKPETFLEEVMGLLRQTSKTCCDAVKEYRRSRRALYRRWMRAMPER